MKAVELALRHDARFILASTSEVYGDPLEHPQKETYWGNVNSIGPRACYDEAKRFSEAYVSSASHNSNGILKKDTKPLNAGIVRIFNTYGPRMRPNDGRVVPELCMQALKGEPLSIHGDGKQTRSFCFVSDLVSGIFKLYENDYRKPVNIGNPIEYSILDFAEVVREIVNPKLEIKHLGARVDDPRKRCPDITTAKSILNWEPKVSLKEGLAQTLEFFRCELP